MIVGLVTLAGCARPYEPPIVALGSTYNTGVAFPGLLDLVQSAKGTKKEDLQVLWAHGMCTHDLDWVKNRSERLAKATGATVEPLLSNEAVVDGQLNLVKRRFQTNEFALSTTFVLWSPMTAPLKERLSSDQPGTDPSLGFPYKRATLNGNLKTKFMNDCFSDAVVYLGPNGNEMRAAFKVAVCTVLGGTYSQGKGCDLMALSEAALDRPIAVVTESLGSKFVFDAVRSVWAESLTLGQEAGKQQQKQLARRLNAISTVYLMSNQIPLLDLADVSKNSGNPAELSGSSLHDFLSVVTTARSAVAATRSASPRGSEPLMVVAFSDPSDLLSYRIVPTTVTLPEAATLVNVTVSNADTYFGYLENPLDAHCGYAWNAQVITMLTKGYNPDDKVTPLAPTLPKGKSCS
jgi:hypothetical protein